MIEPVRFPFVEADPALPATSLMPLLPLTLTHGQQKVSVSGLLDTGASVNVLPYSLGEQLGFEWEQQRTLIVLSGNLARLPARGIVLSATVGPFAPVRLAFA
jgi:hypothetical protein